MTTKYCALLLCSVVLFAQDMKPDKDPPPPELDAALRARISQFYQAHVDGKYRIADQVVAEESKDAYFAAAKPKYLSFEIVRINYFDAFKRAEAVVSCESDWYIQGKKMKTRMPGMSLWKVIDGQWFWYVPPVTERRTPFGTLNYDAAGKSDGNAPAPVAALPADPQVLAQRILDQVKVDKQELTLSSYQRATGEVKISNSMPGSITLRAEIDGKFPGMSLSLDHSTVKAGGTATLTIVYDPKDRVPKPALTARIYVEPTNQVLTVKLLFAIPPELEKQIPKDLRNK